MTLSRAINHINWSNQRPNGISQARWRAMIRQIAKNHADKVNPTLVTEFYGCGTRYHCSRCDTYRGERLPMVSWTNSPTPTHCSSCGGINPNLASS